MIKGLKLLFVTFLIGHIYFQFPKPSFAYTWQLSYPSVDESTYIKISEADSNIVYASVRKSQDFDIVKSTDSGLTWTSIKNNLPQGQDINWISTSPGNNNTVLISLWGAGIFITENGGSSWTKIFNSSTPRSVAISPTDSNKILVGIGGSNSGQSGIYISTNKGSAWNKITALGNRNNAQITIDPNNSNRIFVDIDPNFYRSLDGGSSWTQLPINHAYSTGVLIDRVNSNIIYTGQYDQNVGVYKSSDNGENWQWKNNGFSGEAFHISQNDNGYLFVTKWTGSGGFWESRNNGDLWTNITDPQWSGRSLWGMDIRDYKIFVSVEGLGVYFADTTEEPAPVVLVPGFGGSWSYKGLIENQPTTYADWQLMPFFTDAIYQPLISTVTNAGVTPLIFAYDFRKSISDNAVSLNTFLADKAGGRKANIIAHSMGGLVTRYCYEKVSGCSGKIEKIVTAGTPHQGTLKAYPLWEAGDFGEMDFLTKAATEIALHAGSFPYISDKDIIQNKFPGVRDLLPVSGAPTNTTLQSLSWTTDGVLTSQSGKDFPTNSSFNTTTRSLLDQALNLWVDGKPASYITADGDGTILKASSEISNNKKYYSLQHNDYFKNSTSLVDTLSAFGLVPGAIVTSATNPSSILAFIIRSPATISVNGNTGIDGKAIFISNPTAQTYTITLTGTGNGNYQLDSFYIDGTNNFKRTTSGSITNGSTRTINFDFTPDPAQNFSDSGSISLTSFRRKVADTNLRTLKVIEATVVTAFNDIQNNRNRPAAFNKMESSYLSIWKLLAAENNGTNRRNLRETADQLVAVMDKLNTQYQSNPSASTATAETTRNQTTVTRKAAKSSLSAREAANVVLAQKLMADAAVLKNASKNYQSILLARAAGALSN